MRKHALWGIFFVLCLLISFVSCSVSKEKEESNPSTDSETVTYAQKETELVTVSIPEGYTLMRLSWLLEKKEICTSEDFLSAAEHYDLTLNPILKDVVQNENVCFPLEGYLFPATYAFKRNTPPEIILDELIRTTSIKLKELFPDGKSANGYSVHEILTLASIIEKEALTSEHRGKISAVLHNRLKENMKLQCDVTIKYCEGVIKLRYPEQFDRYKFLYNTYRCDALPAGPICNPGMESIRAAIYPEQLDALYFVIAEDPPYEARFSKDLKEHKENCAALGY